MYNNNIVYVMYTINIRGLHVSGNRIDHMLVEEDLLMMIH